MSKKMDNRNAKTGKFSKGGRKFPRKGNRNPKFDKRSDNFGVTPDDGGHNDDSWWNKMAQLELITRTNLNFPQFGNIIRRFPGNYSRSNSSDANHSLPLICRIGITPTLPISDGTDSTLRLLGIQWYQKLRNINTSTIPFTNANILMYFEAFRSIYGLYAHVKRAVRLTNTVSNVNNAFPEDIMDMLGFDWQSFLDERPQIINYLTTYAARVNAFFVPTEVQTIDRFSWLFSSLYKDQDIDWDRCQLYAFVPDVWYRYYEEVEEEYEPFSLHPVLNSGTTTAQPWSYYKNQLELLLKSIQNSESMKNISIWMDKCCNSTYCLTPPVMTETLLPEYQKDVLFEIANGKLVNLYNPTSADHLQIYEDVNHDTLIQKLDLTAAASTHVYRANILWSEDKDLTTMDIAKGTRFMVDISHNPGSDFNRPTVVGTEIMSSAIIGEFRFNTNNVPILFKQTLALNANPLATTVARIEKFKSFFRLDFTEKISGSVDALLNITGDVDYYRHFDTDELGDINNVLMQSIYGISPNITANKSKYDK